MEKRGQAATEFLTTYGWMILILLIVIVAIASLNVFNPKIQNTCGSVDPIFCSDIKLDGTSRAITLGLSASGTSVKTSPTDLRTKVTEINLTSPWTISCSPASPFVLTDQTTLITCNLPVGTTLSKGNKFSGTANVNYVLKETENSALTHTAQVTYSGTIE